MIDAARMILGPIIGGLTDTSVKLWARANKPSILYGWLATKRDLSDARLRGFGSLGGATGHSGIVALDRLKPDSKYYYALTLDRNSKPSRAAFHSFNTFPSQGTPKSFRFGFGSCFRPGRKNPGRVFKHIHDNEPDLAFMLLLGDQIYADEWNFNGLGRVASNLEDYRAVYSHSWSNIHFRSLLADTPVFMVPDDHEVDNDWRWRDLKYQHPTLPIYTTLIRWIKGRSKNERELSRARVHAAYQATWEHQIMHAPPLLRPVTTLAYSFDYGKTAFFIMDTRTHRVSGIEGRAMLDKGQWRELTEWIQAVKNTHPVKFIVTSVAFLSQLIGDPTNDRWSGWKEERDRLLYLMAAEGLSNVYFLAGDLHSAHAISADIYGVDGRLIPIWEFCSSPFEQICNKYAWLLDRPARSPALRNQKIHFTVSELNYGLVSVDLEDFEKPKVTFEVRYTKDDRWYSKVV